MSKPYGDCRFPQGSQGPVMAASGDDGEGASAPSPDTLKRYTLTGGSSDYYKLDITSPRSGGPAYTVECIDIIKAFRMSFAVGNIFKAAWRLAAVLAGKGKPGNTALYDAEKVVYFGAEVVLDLKGDIEP